MNPSPRPHTLFFALRPDAEARAATAAAVDGILAGQGLRERRVDPARYHLTLHFLGGFSSLPAGLVEAARAAAGQVVGPRLELVFDRAGSFHAPQPPCVLLASRVPGGLASLQRELGEALSRCGVPLPAHARPFVPHCTFAYARHQGVRPVAIEPVLWRVGRFDLLQRNGGAAGYEVLGQWPLVS